jgi:DNA helicase-2/ATP-dependent DNA helicase PcrA
VDKSGLDLVGLHPQLYHVISPMQSAAMQSEIANPPHLSGLNPEQRQAVVTTEGPLLVLAGAGTGKTRVLTTRIAQLLLTKRAFSGQILSVTFTNKAANEMRERVTRLLVENGFDPQAAASVWLGTFHSIGAKILRRHAELAGLTPQFTILDDDDQQRLIKHLLILNNIDHQKFPPRAVLTVIQSWKDRGLPDDTFNSESNNYSVEGVGAKIYPIYQNRLKALNCCDFGDLLLHNLTIFSEHPNVLQEYAQRFKYILVDEYQDANTAQYLWLRLLALGHQNLCCVGDDDQSIYGWRGAEVGNILKFEKDYPTAHVIKLERNYRSTAPILKAASALIANNESRLGKTLWTEATGGAPVRIKSVWDDAEEARFVGEEVESFQRDKIPLSQMAVLVRAGYQTRAFEERFMTLAIPYRVIGGLRFYERMEIRDAVAYLRIIHQPHDDLAFERIINTPKRGIGKATLEQLHIHARERNSSIYAALEFLISHGELKGKTAGTLQNLLSQFSAWRKAATEKPLNELADAVLEESGYRAMWQADKSPEAAGRIENLRELVRALGDFKNLEEFLEHVGLVTDGNQQAADDMVSIMSLHAAKGLEFDSVFLTGWEEGLFPSQRTMDELGTRGLEEERRLAYVGITRARKFATISHAANRRIYNQWQSSVPSRFIEELPPDVIEAMDGGPYTKRAAGPALFQRGMEEILATRVETKPTELPALRKGARVKHEHFGYGVILNVEGDHLQIAFKHAGVKKMLADYIEVA